VKFSTRQIATATGRGLTHQTVAVYLRGGSVSPASRKAVEAALDRLERERQTQETFDEIGREVVGLIATGGV
jgi:hypothetical protein